MLKEVNSITARDVGWSIISTDFSPDGRWLIYSSWSDYVYIANTMGEHEIHQALNFSPDSQRFCLFSIQFSPDSREILGGSCDKHIYIYDLDRREILHKIIAHMDDINAVAYADNSNQIIYSGSDDSLIKIWDRRALNDNKCGCVGVLQGHTEGITFIDSKKDGVYLISNGKDQCIKLWDIRKMKDHLDCKPKLSRFEYNTFYGYAQMIDIIKSNKRHPDDQSIMTYKGNHRILQTLIRCRFSPCYTTGQRYIYTGSYDGNVYIYDIITGELVKSLNHRGRGTVRDMHWHPFKPIIVTSSWGGTVKKWVYDETVKENNNENSDDDQEIFEE